MHISDLVKNSNGKFRFSLEVIPPLKGAGIQDFFQQVDPLMEFNPAFVDVTYHQEEQQLRRNNETGLLELQRLSKRPGTVAVSVAIKERFKVETVPHMICGSFSKEDTENALIDLHYLGIENLLLLRGDTPRGQAVSSEKMGYASTLELVNQVKNLNHGVYLDPHLENSVPTNFCIGVAAYPEKHRDAPNMESDLEFLKRKVDAGAQYVVTQMFYDNRVFWDFKKRAQAAGITVPIIPGLKPLTTQKQVQTLPGLFALTIPYDLTKALESVKTAEDVSKVGRDWCVQQSRELQAAGEPVLHYYTMGRSKHLREVVSQLF
jgi:methylenetetrahydrofolate reductase (NADPH)